MRRSWDCAPACVDRRPPLPIRNRGGRGLYENAAPIFIRYACGDAGIIWFPGASQDRGVSPSIHRKRGDPLTRFQARNLPGAASHWQSPDTCPGGDLLTTFSVRYFPEIPFPSLPRLSRICHHAPPAHGWRRSAAKNVQHGGDPMASNHDRTGLMGSHLPPEKGGGIRFRIVDLMASYYSSRKGNTQSSRIKPPASG